MCVYWRTMRSEITVSLPWLFVPLKGVREKTLMISLYPLGVLSRRNHHIGDTYLLLQWHPWISFNPLMLWLNCPEEKNLASHFPFSIKRYTHIHRNSSHVNVGVYEHVCKWLCGSVCMCVCVRVRIDSPEDQLISGLSERQETGSENGHHRALWMCVCEYTVLRFSFRCNGALKPV